VCVCVRACVCVCVRVCVCVCVRVRALKGHLTNLVCACQVLRSLTRVVPQSAHSFRCCCTTCPSKPISFLIQDGGKGALGGKPIPPHSRSFRIVTVKRNDKGRIVQRKAFYFTAESSGDALAWVRNTTSVPIRWGMIRASIPFLRWRSITSTPVRVHDSGINTIPLLQHHQPALAFDGHISPNSTAVTPLTLHQHDLGVDTLSHSYKNR
jgi:hypothetical protein